MAYFMLFIFCISFSQGRLSCATEGRLVMKKVITSWQFSHISLYTETKTAEYRQAYTSVKRKKQTNKTNKPTHTHTNKNRKQQTNKQTKQQQTNQHNSNNKNHSSHVLLERHPLLFYENTIPRLLMNLFRGSKATERLCMLPLPHQ